MGFFDVILKSIGFDVDDGEKKQKKAKKQKITDVAPKTQMSAKFNLSKSQQPEVKIEQKQVEQPSIVEKDSGLSVQAEIGKNIAVFAPVSVDELGGIVDFTRKRLAAIVNLSNLTNTEMEKALDFLNGAMYAMRGQVSKLDAKLYLVAPEGTATITNEE